MHGGPTAHTAPRLSTAIAYFTSRGIGIIDVNYGGSTGYGREYRDRLRGQWGVVDVEDTVAAIVGLADAGLADRARLAIEGGSAGGWTVLAALTSQRRVRLRRVALRRRRAGPVRRRRRTTSSRATSTG